MGDAVGATAGWVRGQLVQDGDMAFAMKRVYEPAEASDLPSDTFACIIVPLEPNGGMWICTSVGGAPAKG